MDMKFYLLLREAILSKVLKKKLKWIRFLLIKLQKPGIRRSFD